MSKQIAVRLPNDLVDYLDEQVRLGDGVSRAAIVSRALNRERRRTTAAKDAAILAVLAGDPDMKALARYAASLPIDLD